MRLVMMNGGLGNQAFQYIFMRYIEEHSGEPCIIDDLYFCDDKALHNGYELEKIFSLKPRRLSQMLSEDVVQEILKLKQPAPGTSHPAHDIVSILRTSGISLNVIQEADLYEHDYHVCLPDAKSYPINQFSPQILRNHGNLYYYGYWINAYWYEAIMDIINYEFTFPCRRTSKTHSCCMKFSPQTDLSASISGGVISLIAAGFLMKNFTAIPSHPSRRL